GGYALDALDVQIYSMVIPVLIGIGFLTQPQAGYIATSTLVLSAVGGWIAGIMADKLGRVRTLQLTVVWVAVFTALCGLTTGFWGWLAFRGLQGLGFGGEWAAGAVLIGEVVQARHRGKAVGFVQGSWSVGWAAAVILATVILSVVPKEYAWRCLFLVGILPAFTTFLIRRHVSEPEAFTKAQASSIKAPGTLAIFGPHLWWTTLRCSLLALGAQGGYYAITTWLPTFLRTERHITVVSSLGYLLVVTAGSFVGYVASAYLNDAIGRRRNFILFALGSGLIVFAYTHIAVSNGWMMVLGFPLGFFASGIFSGMGPLLTEMFPTEVRAAGQGFCYNAGRGVAAFFPALVGSVAANIGLGNAIGVFAASAYALVLVIALLLPETKGRVLASYADMVSTDRPASRPAGVPRQAR
ncbi:MAG TPA: MFS transporter, partial [Rhodopila sp.]|nr:MFS transporter [Rhodopila sp.]